MASSSQQSGLVASAQQTANEEDLTQTQIVKLTKLNLEGLRGGPSINQLVEGAVIDQDQLTNQNSLRKQSMESISSYTSNENKQMPSSEQKAKKSKQMMIKKKEFKVQTAALNIANNLQPTTRIITIDELERSESNQFGNFQNAPQIVGGGFNQQYITDQSDSDLSAFEMQSIGSTMGIRNSGLPIVQYQNQQQLNGVMMNSSVISNINSITPVSTSRVFNIEGELLRLQAQEDVTQVQFLNKTNQQQFQRDPYHPFADKLSPFEEWKQILVLASETTKQFILHDIILNTIYFTWSCFMYTLLLPIGAIGLMIEYTRVLKNKCFKKRDEVDPFIRVAPPKAQDKLSNQQEDQDKREAIEAAMFRKQQESLSLIRMPERGDFTIVVDLDHTLVYSQSIKTRTDSMSKSQVTDSFMTIQSLNLELNGGGQHYKVLKRPYVDQFLKRMSEMGQVHIFTAATKSYADPVIDMIDPNGYVTGRYYREHCKTDKNGNLIKPMDIITTNLTRLIIIDDSEIVYNMYKENTIKIPQWIPNANAGKRQDKKLLDCIQIMEQLNCVTKFKDVRQNLKNIIDTENKYNE